MLCPVCEAPAVPRSGACIFCRSPLVDGVAPPSVLTYLSERIPKAASKRSGLFKRGPVHTFEVTIGDQTFTARNRRGQLQLKPDLEAGAWIEALLIALSNQAGSDSDTRSVVSHAGWALRQDQH